MTHGLRMEKVVGVGHESRTTLSDEAVGGKTEAVTESGLEGTGHASHLAEVRIRPPGVRTMGKPVIIAVSLVISNGEEGVLLPASGVRVCLSV